jgi:hypothetical protein
MASCSCVYDLLDDFANDNNLNRTTDIHFIPVNISMSDIFNPNNITFNMTDIDDYLLTQVNKTQVAVIFVNCNYSEPSLEYMIMYNATRAFRIQQLFFGSPNKPDGRNEVQLGLDRAFIGRLVKKQVNMSVQMESFPKLYQQQSTETKQVCLIFSSIHYYGMFSLKVPLYFCFVLLHFK